MKACITTFQSAYNYGAILQAYALQECLNENFAETSILDYHNKEIDASYQNPHLKDYIHNPKNAIFKTVQGILYKGKKRKIDDFRNRYLKLTKRYDAVNISDAKNEADIFVTGSDQVWNYLIVDRDGTYYLDFADEKRTCSYAASFGVASIPTEYQGFYKENLNNIDYVSVRESAGAEIVKDMTGRDAKVMPDPTLLVNREVWNRLSITPDIKGKYILVYKITKADKLLKFSKKLSERTGLPIVYIPNDLKSGSIGKLKTNVGPEEWLGYIKNAEYVVTNSFHGTVFSILFNKKFFSEVSSKVNPSTSRLNSLLKMFGLERRTIEQFTENLLTEEIDSEAVNRVLISQKNKAHEFFKEVF